MWLYKKEVIESIEQMPQNTFGFIYEATYIPTNEKYLGKKVLFFNRTLPPLKGTKRKRKVVKESDWQTYYGSHTKIKQLLSEGKQEDFIREIIEFAFNKKHLTYLETKYQFSNNVLENTEYINDNILGKFFRKDLVNPNS
jgi:hypothetical protein|tara:strand:+ start:351 stop:770 length:420 start_codon:yes stop_codon:yes gene_type:complete